MLAKEAPAQTETCPQLLFIDDEEGVRRFIGRSLPELGYRTFTASHWDEAKELLHNRRVQPDIVFFEPCLGGKADLQGLRSIQEWIDEIPVVVISSERRPGLIVEAIQNGAWDYLVKPFGLESLRRIIDRILEARQEEAGSTPREPALPAEDFVVCNPRMIKIRDMIQRIAHSRVPVLIEGETGVGKDIIARQIHLASRWSHRPFVKVNCAALPHDLTESELFGHTRGAFTGAQMDRVGKFKLADGGTIFLDEIGEFPLGTQAKLLQVLQDGHFAPLGSDQETQVDVRVIAATNRNLEEAIAQKQFRSDLFYRLHVLGIQVPPLRDRTDEIPMLCRHFLSRLSEELGESAAELPESMLQAFASYDWPGNVRELENLVKRFLVLRDQDAIHSELTLKSSRQVFESVDELADQYLNKLDQGVSLKLIAKEAAARVERSVIATTLARTRWNKWQAAKELGVSYKTLLTRIEDYGIKP